jgi:hypothetical protein
MTNDQQTVDEIDKARRQYFSRSPDRPQGRVRTRSRQPKEVVRAKDRLKTAAWRDKLDRLKRPEGAAVAMQFLVSTVAVAREAGLDGLEAFRNSEVAFQHALDELVSRGFDRDECKSVVKRLTRRAK